MRKDYLKKQLCTMKFWELVDYIDAFEKDNKMNDYFTDLECYELNNFLSLVNADGIVIWGAGSDGRKAKRILDILGKKDVIWCDKEKNNEIIGDIPIANIYDVLPRIHGKAIIIASRRYQNEILEEILNYDVTLKRNVFLHNEISAWNKHNKEYKKKAILSYPPLWLTVGVTSACSNKCLFCSYHGDAAKGISNAYGLPYMLSFHDFKRIVDMADEAGVPRVHICGTGEPFFKPDILKMADYVIEKYGEVSLQTEFGKRLFDKHGFLDELIKREQQITYISTDVLSGIPEEHERIKQGATYKELMEAMEYIGKKSSLLISVNVILTRSNYKNITKIIDDFIDRNVNMQLSIVNLLSYDYSDYTSSDNVYRVGDKSIEEELSKVKKYAAEKGIRCNVPEPAGSKLQDCYLFWRTFQTWPVSGCEKERYGENMIPHACSAVIRGELNSLGYLFDYNTLMEAWNNEILVKLRTDMMNGIYPSEWCKKCMHYSEEDSYYLT